MMPYLGETVRQCFTVLLPFEDTYVVVVSGKTSCGHMLLNVGGKCGQYFHFTGPSRCDLPLAMNAQGYRRYLRENGKREVSRTRIQVPDPVGASRKLEELLASRWCTLLVEHNCVDFVSQVTQAGGGPEVPGFCPTGVWPGHIFW
jgi:hypothetical protein